MRIANQHPKLQLEFVATNDVENSQVGFIEIRRADPPGGELDAVLLQRLDFFVELRNVFGPPVVGNLADAQIVEHLGTRFRTPLSRIERNDAPGDEILAQNRSGSAAERDRRSR